MRFYVWTASSDGDCLAYRLAQEGHEVVLRIEEEWCRGNLEGMVPHTQSAPRQGDVVIFGTSKSGTAAAALREEGFLVVGGAPIADTLEMQRWTFCQACEQLGIAIPDTKRFTKYDDAREFLQDDGGRFVFKPCGDKDCADTYVSHDADEMLLSLNRFEHTIPKADFLLQRFEEGVEISLEGWFDGERWVDGAWNATMEAKKLMVGDIGPATGCAWSTVWPYDAAKEPSWATRLHRKFTDVLRKGEYCGPFDLNCIVTADAMYTLEPTPRFGYAAIQNFVELWNVPVGETLMALASGTLERLDVETDLLVAAVVLSIPPYPNASKAHRAPGDVPALIDEGDMQRLWPSGLRYDSDTDQYLSAPTFGLVGTLVAHGTTLGRAVAKLLASASRVRIPNLQYRNDIGEGNEGKWQQLADWGYDLPPTATKMVQRATQAPTRRPSGLGRMARA